MGVAERSRDERVLRCSMKTRLTSEEGLMTVLKANCSCRVVQSMQFSIHDQHHASPVVRLALLGAARSFRWGL